MAGFRLERGEQVKVDLTSSLSSLTFPLLELILITGLFWMGIGYLDRPEVIESVPMELRNAVVIIWLALAVWRFVLPVIRARRRRFVVTDRRVMLRAGRFGARVDSIPLRQIQGASRRRNRISLAIAGYQRPLFFRDIPKAKKAVAAINEGLPPRLY
ncbi:PH domain-containing protein [Corynebacterium halotolerans]|uniref:PH domain-containing protein n=1 Tax=Corynebacterium halotolerans TaxID=225326 RepID=UPI003CF5170A